MPPGPITRSAGSGQDMVSRRRIPFHGRAAAHIDVGLARRRSGRISAPRRSCAGVPIDRDGQAGFRGVIAVPPTHESDEIVLGSRVAPRIGGPAEIIDRCPLGYRATWAVSPAIQMRPMAGAATTAAQGRVALDEGDIDAVFAGAVDEVAGSVEGIDEKEEIVRLRRRWRSPRRPPARPARLRPAAG